MRSHRLTLVVGLLVLAGIVAVWFFVLKPIRDHRRWYEQVRSDLFTLVHKRPPNVTKGQWEYTVGWTINLHANAGSIHETVDSDWRDRFATELHRRVDRQITLADVEWIWDEYAAHTKYGQDYSKKYRPTNSKEFANAQEGCFFMPVE